MDALVGSLSVDATGAPVPLPEGLHVWPDIVSQATHDAVVAAIDTGDTHRWDESPLARRTTHYGFRYGYPLSVSTSEVDTAIVSLPLPDWSRDVLSDFAKASPEAKRHAATFDQMIVSEYEAGQGIGRHVDAVKVFAEGIAGFSLLSGCCLRFTPLVPAADRPVVEVYLPARAALLMTGPSRYDYKHEIPRRAADFAWGERRRRLSLTFRTVVRK